MVYLNNDDIMFAFSEMLFPTNEPTLRSRNVKEPSSGSLTDQTSFTETSTKCSSHIYRNTKSTKGVFPLNIAQTDSLSYRADSTRW